MTKHRNELRNLEMQLSTMRDNEADLLVRVDQLSKDREELYQQAQESSKLAREESFENKHIENNAEIEKLEKQVREEKLRKKEKELRRLKHELTTEKEKFNQMVAKNQADIQNLQATLYEESQARLKLSMELDTKESEVENLQLKLTHINSRLDAESISSVGTE